MTPITRRAGLICVVAAALIICSEVLRLGVGLVSGPGSAATLTHTLTYGLAIGGMSTLLLALTALYGRHHNTLGVLGLTGYLTASMGTLLVAGDWWFEAFAVPIISAEAPDVLNLPPGGSILLGALITTGLFAAGWTTFGIALLRSRTVPRPAATLLILAGACGVLALSTPYQIPLAIAIGWIGLTLARASQAELSVAESNLPVTQTPGSAS